MVCYGKPPCDEGVVLGPPCRGQRFRKPGWILTATILGSSMAFIDGTVVNIALPTLQAELNASVAGLQWVVEAYALFLAALMLVGGALGDRCGRRRLFLIGIGIFAVASVGCGAATTTRALIAARAAQGVGGALLVPGSLAIISASFPKAERGRAIGIWSGFSAMSAGMGLVLGGLILDVASWRWLFWINVPIALVTLGIALGFVPESRDEGEGRGPLDLPGALLATAGLGGLTLGFVETSVRGWRAPLVIGALVAGLVSCALFVLRESRAGNPMLPLGLFRIRAFAAANLLTLFLYAALAGVMFFFPMNLIQIQGYSATAAGAANLPFILLMFLLSRWSGGLVGRFGSRLPLVLGPLLAGVGMALFARTGIGESYWTDFFPALLVLGLGMALSVAPLTTTVMTSVDERHAGVASGVNNATSRIAAVLAIAIFGPIMLHGYATSLERRLTDLPLNGETHAAVLGEAVRLGAAEVPAGVPAALGDTVARAFDEAFVSGHHTVAWITCLLAVFASLSAMWLIPRPAPVQATAAPRRPARRPVPGPRTNPAARLDVAPDRLTPDGFTGATGRIAPTG